MSKPKPGTVKLTAKQIEALRLKIDAAGGVSKYASALKVAPETISRALAGLDLRRGTLAILQPHVG